MYSKFILLKQYSKWIVFSHILKWVRKLSVTDRYFELCYTKNVETFAGLNIRGFCPMKFFAGILLQCLGQQCLLFKY